MLTLTVPDHTYTSVRASSFTQLLIASSNAQGGTQLQASATLGASAFAFLDFL